MLKHRVLAFVNAPDQGVLSSQTLYEILLCALDMREVDEAGNWDLVAREATQRLLEIQLPDGGFDIGYNFRFGARLEKSHDKESTSPEVIAVTALARHASRFDDQPVLPAIEAGVHWIEQHLVTCDAGVAIPYAPLTSPAVHITNATSFAVAALAIGQQVLGRLDASIDTIEQMYRFMHCQLETGPRGGAYWPYFHQTHAVAGAEPGRDKIDNYHIGQQLYHHCIAHDVVPSARNLEIIEAVAHYLLSVQDEQGFLPYTIKNGRPSGAIDVWGYASVATGLLAAGQLTGRQEFTTAAEKIERNVWHYFWNGRWFYPIIARSDCQPIDARFYPRSDAWVLHALAMSCRQRGTATLEQVAALRSCVDLIRRGEYRGAENHTLTARKRAFGVCVRVVVGWRDRLRIQRARDA